MVMQGRAVVMASAAVVHYEVEFSPIYESQLYTPRPSEIR
jgi:hypothetical protein